MDDYMRQVKEESLKKLSKEVMFFEKMNLDKEIEKSSEIFNLDYFKKNKDENFFIYKNKMHKFEEIITIEKDDKIKLISLKNTPYIIYIINSKETLSKNQKKEKNDKSNKKIGIKIKYPYYDVSLLVYNINPGEKKIKIFGENFVKNNNKNNYFIKYNGEYQLLNEYAYIKDTNENSLFVTLYGNNKITDKSYMFHKCDSLEYFILLKGDDKNKKVNYYKELDDDPKVSRKYKDFYLDNGNYGNTINSSDKKSLLEEYKQLSFYLKDYDWKFSKSTNMEHMFDGCSSLISLPDMSRWDTSNVINLSYIFSGCSALKTLSDISTWEANKVIDMSNMFKGCSSLVSL